MPGNRFIGAVVYDMISFVVLRKRRYPKPPRKSGHLAVSRCPAPRTADINTLTRTGKTKGRGREASSIDRLPWKLVAQRCTKLLSCP